MKLPKPVNSLFLAILVLFSFSACQRVPVHPVARMLVARNRPQGANHADLFTMDDTVQFSVSMTWDDVTQNGGFHIVRTNWYKGDTLVSTNQRFALFTKAPYFWRSWRSAFGLGQGNFKVEILVDDQSMGSAEFTIQ